MDFGGIANVAAITTIAFLIGQFVKVTPIDNKWIPVICGTVGGILGIVALYIGVPDFPATDVLTAAAVGITSGFAATGAHQIYKQFTDDTK